MKKDNEIVSKERKCGDLQNMNMVVGSFARKILGKKAFIEADIIHNWHDIVGEEIAQLSRPIKVDFKKDERRNGVLHIEAASGALALELQQKSKIIMDKVNVFFGYEAVSRLKIMQNLQIMKDEKKSLSTDNSEKKLVTAKEENYIRQQLKGINNSELSSALEQIGRFLVVNNKE
ncbi:MAG: DUF721 domain-containing protein [Alphaproteobacteria bacterium]|nr:DUF721 domain-containing protein [Alphaproteobacteria bacterium]